MIKIKQYARGLFEALDGKKESEQKKIAEKFALLLIENNDISKLTEILRMYEKMRNEADGVIEAEIVSARELDVKTIKSLKDFILEKASGKKIVIKEKQDKNLIGGVVLRYGDKSLDLSIRRRLNEFKDLIIG